MSGKDQRKNSPINGTDQKVRENGALPAGTLLKERYELEKVLGRGGFGITYRAMDRNVQAPVAVKEYLTESGEETKRAVKEARIAASLYDLDGIVAVRDYFVENGTAYIVMEYVHGISIKQYIAQHGRMSGEEVLDGIRPLLVSIQKIHEKGILHRDISADNLMITPEGRFKLIDFGAASALDPQRKEHTVLIKRGFVPVEQYRAEEKLGPWTDIYSLCATIYFMITGMVPQDAMERWINDRLTSLTDIYGTGLTEAQSRAVMKGMAVRREDRYGSAAELYRDLYARENLPHARKWFQTEELPHQILSGHTRTLRREAALALQGKNGAGKNLLRSAIAVVIALLLAAGLWFYLGRTNGAAPALAETSPQAADVPASPSGTLPEADSAASPTAKDEEDSSAVRSAKDKAGTAASHPPKDKPASSGKQHTAAKHTPVPRTDTAAGGDSSHTAQKSSPAKTAKPAAKASAPKTDPAGNGSSKKSEFEGDLDDLLR